MKKIYKWISYNIKLKVIVGICELDQIISLEYLVRKVYQTSDTGLSYPEQTGIKTRVYYLTDNGSGALFRDSALATYLVSSLNCIYVNI